MGEPISPNGPVKVAITVDDFLQWKMVPFPTGYSAERVVSSLTSAFADFGITDCYAFFSTGPMEEDPSLREQVEAWCAAGHHVGNHTHNHVSPDWVTASAFTDDIKLSEYYIGSFIEAAPVKYFRYPMDMWGAEADKVADIHHFLARENYIPAPVSYWFYDAQFVAPYWRSVESADSDAAAWLVRTYAETAVDQLRRHAAVSREMFGRDPIFISVFHGTAVTSDSVRPMLEALVAAGVEFVSLEEGMRDPLNALPAPMHTRLFRNSTQKWADHLGVSFEGIPPLETLSKLEKVSPREGMSYEDVFGAMRNHAAKEVGGTVAGGEFDWQSAVRPIHD
ncbi:polysaccharide deacetylase family protein [Micromonospora inyonensis]|uniref:Polysaccharide deacetylase n=1 Tax=Micromonospora inyonensis TaxID=47866 RepID=A0A1C6RZE3_9ACTN|nr:polysaccharide deacetylase family protein [Micromonospora inyonensis]SCL22608.1 Polysaccharide deacetylase [Micromonospora inyonensis]